MSILTPFTVRHTSRSIRSRTLFGGRAGIGLMFLALFLTSIPGPEARAQGTVSVGNEHIMAHVSVDDRSGKFGITTGAAHDNTRFLFQTLTLITSHVVFRVDQAPQPPRFACNVPKPFGPGLPRPKYQGNEIDFKPYDKIYYNSDTIAVTWNNVFGFRITMRFVPEKPSSVYDDGADMLLEFTYERTVYSYAQLGIILMLDTYNSGASSLSGGGFGDQTSIVSPSGYFQVDTPGRKFYDPYQPVPEFYHVGNFLYEDPLNSVLPIHRLRGTSRNGAPLTLPNIFAIDDWKRLREVAWDLPITVGTEGFKDCATWLRWEDLVGRGTVRTAFGMNNKGSNDMYHCRDKQLFADIRTKRIVRQDQKNGPYDPEQFEVEAWITNTSTQYGIAPIIRLKTPIASIPDSTERLKLDPSTPAAQSLQLGPRQTKKITWVVNVNHASTDTMAILKLTWEKPGFIEESPFLDECEPKVAIIGFHDPPPAPPKDSIPPTISRTGSGRDRTAFWSFGVTDRHLWFDYDTGLDSIAVLEDTNFDLMVSPYPFRRCDTTESVSILAEVGDTTKPGRLIFSVTDCRGNISYDTIQYRPRPDIYKPEWTSENSGSLGPPCNNRVFNIFVGDSTNQFTESGDHGLETIEVLGTPINFKPIEINFDIGGLPVRRFDKRASFRMEVQDTMLDASASIRVVDVVGNDTIIDLQYCTLPDILAPEATAVLLGNRESWDVTVSDKRGWDRGLLEVVEISNLGNNISFTPPPIKPGDQEAVLPTLYVIDNAQDAQITLEVRDLEWARNPVGHATRFTLRFSHIPDTLAPNIIFTPDPLTVGSVGDVEVNDIHYINNTLYKYDVGLSQVNVTAVSPNMRVRPVTPISFTPGAESVKFQVEIIDTLTFNILDSICLEAIDLAGNRSTKCYYYPVVPDVRSPIFIGELSADRSAINGTASDNRLYDRGLGSILVEDEKNVEPDFSIRNLAGTPTTGVSIAVLDPRKSIAGTLVINDLVADRDQSGEAKVIHSVRIPFYQPSVSLALDFPDQIEGGAPINVAVTALDSFPGSMIKAIDLTLQHAGDAMYTGPRGVAANFTVTDMGSGRLAIRALTDRTRHYAAGDTLGVLTFSTLPRQDIGRFRLTVDTTTMAVNDREAMTVSVLPPDDDMMSILKLTSIAFNLSADSITMINGECERILTGGPGALKTNGLAILGITPQPVTTEIGRNVDLLIRDLPVDGGYATIIDAGGNVVARVPVDKGIGAGVSRITLELPGDVISGVYFIGISASTGEDIVKVSVRR